MWECERVREGDGVAGVALHASGRHASQAVTMLDSTAVRSGAESGKRKGRECASEAPLLPQTYACVVCALGGEGGAAPKAVEENETGEEGEEDGCFCDDDEEEEETEEEEEDANVFAWKKRGTRSRTGCTRAASARSFS